MPTGRGIWWPRAVLSSKVLWVKIFDICCSTIGEVSHTLQCRRMSTVIQYIWVIEYSLEHFYRIMYVMLLSLCFLLLLLLLGNFVVATTTTLQMKNNKNKKINIHTFCVQRWIMKSCCCSCICCCYCVILLLQQQQQHEKNQFTYIFCSIINNSIEDVDYDQKYPHRGIWWLRAVLHQGTSIYGDPLGQAQIQWDVPPIVASGGQEQLSFRSGSDTVRCTPLYCIWWPRAVLHYPLGQAQIQWNVPPTGSGFWWPRVVLNQVTLTFGQHLGQTDLVVVNSPWLIWDETYIPLPYRQIVWTLHISVVVNTTPMVVNSDPIVYMCMEVIICQSPRSLQTW